VVRRQPRYGTELEKASKNRQKEKGGEKAARTKKAEHLRSPMIRQSTRDSPYTCQKVQGKEPSSEPERVGEQEKTPKSFAWKILGGVLSERKERAR